MSHMHNLNPSGIQSACRQYTPLIETPMFTLEQRSSSVSISWQACKKKWVMSSAVRGLPDKTILYNAPQNDHSC